MQLEVLSTMSHPTIRAATFNSSALFLGWSQTISTTSTHRRTTYPHETRTVSNTTTSTTSANYLHVYKVPSSRVESSSSEIWIVSIKGSITWRTSCPINPTTGRSCDQRPRHDLSSAISVAQAAANFNLADLLVVVAPS